MLDKNPERDKDPECRRQRLTKNGAETWRDKDPEIG